MMQTIDYKFAFPGSRCSLFAALIRPANAGVVFNGCAVVFGGSARGGGAIQEPGPRRGFNLCIEVRAK